MPFKKMNPEVKERWVAALRSGKYRQTRGTLNEGDVSFCCLGVLCDTEGLGWEISNPYNKVRVIKDFPKSYGGMLPGVLLDRFGFTGRAQELLIEKNDVRQDNFESIANWIEENL